MMNTDPVSTYGSEESEQTLIGLMCREPTNIYPILETLSSEDFCWTHHRAIIWIAESLIANGKSLDIALIAADIPVENRQDYVNYMQELARVVPNSNIKDHIEVVHREATRTRIRNATVELDEIAATAETTPDLETEALSLMQSLFSGNKAQPAKPVGEVKQEFMERLQGRIDGEICGMFWGYEELDALTEGAQEGDLIILGGRPSHGKTMLALNLARFQSKSYPCIVFSMEMDRLSLYERMISSVSQIPATKLRAGDIDAEQMKKISNAADLISNHNLRIDEQGGLTFTQIEHRVRQMKLETGCKIVYIDYLQLMPTAGDNRSEGLGHITRALKTMAQNEKVAVVLLSQLNRSLESRPDKRPILSDLRESGAIEQDADLVMFVYDEEKYDPFSGQSGLMEVIIRKQRNGPIGSTYLNINAEIQVLTQGKAPLPPMASPSKTTYEYSPGAKQD